MRYPEIEPYARGSLDVGDGHHLSWDASGNPGGLPVLVLHGGPGGRTTVGSRRWFDPRFCRIITFDQRGCGGSVPHASVTANTTPHLVADIEALRVASGVDRWTIMGHSWGSALALAYAEAHPDRVAALLLASVFTARCDEIAWLYEGRAAASCPAGWARFASAAAVADGDVLAAYRAELTCGDAGREMRAARAWCLWEHELAAPPRVAFSEPDAAVRARAVIGLHYMSHGAFLSDAPLIANAGRLRTISGVIVHGSADSVTSVATARDLHEAWPSSRLIVVEGAGHLTSEPAMMRALIEASDALIAGVVPGGFRHNAISL